jgi:hypothetical protein
VSEPVRLYDLDEIAAAWGVSRERARIYLSRELPASHADGSGRRYWSAMPARPTTNQLRVPPLPD